MHTPTRTPRKASTNTNNGGSINRINNNNNNNNSPLRLPTPASNVQTTPITKSMQSTDNLGQQNIMRKLRNGLDCMLVSSTPTCQYRFKTLLQIRTIMNAIWIFWRTNPSVVGAEMCFLRDVTVLDSEDGHGNNTLCLYFIDMKVVLDITDSTIDAKDLTKVILQIKASSDKEEASDSADGNKESGGVLDPHFDTMRKFTYDTAAQEESVRSLISTINRQDSCMLIDKHFKLTYARLTRTYLLRWKDAVRDINDKDMEADRTRWRLHAFSNMDTDLQAWYHAVFNRDVYRLRGAFWYRDAILPSYRKSYSLVDHQLSPLEEAALSNVLCSPDTTYGDVAGQMFVMQEVVKPELYDLFQKLSAQGAMITKYPRQGRPSKKLFRLSYVDGHIYLTWKGKLGNQGVDLGEISNVSCGLASDLLKKRANKEKAGQYLSLASTGRSVDLFFSSADECGQWQRLLKSVVAKEQGMLHEVPSNRPSDGPQGDQIDWLIFCYSCGTRVDDVEVRDWSNQVVEPDNNVAADIYREEEMKYHSHEHSILEGGDDTDLETEINNVQITAATITTNSCSNDSHGNDSVEMDLSNEGTLELSAYDSEEEG